MKVLGIGNAIVDVVCKVDENFLTKNNLTKSSMKLVDEVEFKKLLSNLKIEQTVAGGSVANSMVGLSQLKNKVSFIGKINDDKLGKSYEESLTTENVNFCYKKKSENIPTGTCLILVTPDDIDDSTVKNSEMVFLEGYLWDEGEPKAAFDKAMRLAKKSAMTLSDKFCVERHKKSFFDLVKNKLDIAFANEKEIIELINAKSMEEVITFAKQINKLLIITRSDKGSIAIQGNYVYECEARKNLEIVDLTGAGDLFAAGFLHGYINNVPIDKSLLKGTEMASKIIQKIGARLS